jgi:hypothetical protein
MRECRPAWARDLQGAIRAANQKQAPSTDFAPTCAEPTAPELAYAAARLLHASGQPWIRRSAGDPGRIGTRTAWPRPRGRFCPRPVVWRRRARWLLCDRWSSLRTRAVSCRCSSRAVASVGAAGTDAPRFGGGSARRWRRARSGARAYTRRLVERQRSRSGLGRRRLRHHDRDGACPAPRRWASRCAAAWKRSSVASLWSSAVCVVSRCHWTADVWFVDELPKAPWPRCPGVRCVRRRRPAGVNERGGSDGDYEQDRPSAGREGTQ